MNFRKFLETQEDQGEYNELDSKLRRMAYTIGSGLGWKIHIATGDEYREQAIKQIEWIRKESKIPFKFKSLSGGEAGEKDITIYVGPKQSAINVARWISQNYLLKKLKPSREILMDDIEIFNGVYARFDAAFADRRFAKYGNKGWDMLKEDKEKMFLSRYGNPFSKDEASKRAYNVLSNIYRTAFTG